MQSGDERRWSTLELLALDVAAKAGGPLHPLSESLDRLVAHVRSLGR